MIEEIDLQAFTFLEWGQYCFTLYSKRFQSWIDEAQKTVKTELLYDLDTPSKTLQEKLKEFMATKINDLQGEFVQITPPFLINIHAHT